MPAGIPPLFLKMCRYIIAKPLYYLFNLSLSEGLFPEYWKKSFISPILKSGNKNNVRNYRPISRLSIIPKVFEAIISKKISNLLSNSISLSQHGFLPKHSINTNLLVYQNFFINSLDQGYQVDLIYTDFEKAFDKVNHSLLFFKLKHWI